MNEDKLGLADAYAVDTPDDNRALYRDWATTYESDYMDAHAYIYHRHVVELFAATCEAPAGQLTPAAVLDVGCGTGVAGVELARLADSGLGDWVIDGIDISPEMLAVAKDKVVDGKRVYRTLSEVDVTLPLPLATASYDGVISSGTFTHGHLGPEPLRELVRIASSGARFAIGINAEHFEARGFAAALDQLVADGLIVDLAMNHVAMYDASATNHEHAHDRAAVPTFRRTGS